MYALGKQGCAGRGRRKRCSTFLTWVGGMGTRRFHLGHLHEVLMKQPTTKFWWKTGQEIQSSAERLARNIIINIYR